MKNSKFKIQKFLLATLILFVFVLFNACNKMEDNNTFNPLDGKLKEIQINLTGQSYFYILQYDSLNHTFVKAELNYTLSSPTDTFTAYNYSLSYNNNNINLSKIGQSSGHQTHYYNISTQNNTITHLFEIDTITNMDYPIFGYSYSAKLDSVFESYNSSLDNFLKCYGYNFDGNNYTDFAFEYNHSNTPFGIQTQVKDTAFITYTNLPFNKYAPMQNMYSLNTLSYFGSQEEIITDVFYLLGFEDYYFYPHNHNLIESIRTVHDTTTIVYFNYEFNTKNQLSKVIINFREPNTPFMVYEYVYY